MKLAKPSEAEVEALLDLARVLQSAQNDYVPCKPDGSWEEGEDVDFFDVEDKEHLRKFYDRVMGCIDKHPGGLNRTVWGFKLAWDNNVFDPDADVYEWHPTLRKAVEEREKAKGGAK